ncbi:hypothetical protein KGF56_002178 [Candida oxycetoniae]|uniref:Kinesin motor domain-containing protein n=1 Tax=Candida oxycetoniae TaxID=497107 RepID=A0AAI9WYD1_9ASCO|nr:uncharacterized protein KGF56_002178 [Candida oxycetoniae]KAI3405013.2 hypothetical protein KGF56_002178 [Candida oxycetoniae]
MSIPLYLKVSGGGSGGNGSDSNGNGNGNGGRCFTVTSPQTIEFMESTFDFHHIFQELDTDYSQLFKESRNSCIVLMGPTGSGKTTMLKQLVAAQLKQHSETGFISCFEMANNKYIVDLLDSSESESTKRIAIPVSRSFDTKLKRTRANPEIIKSLLKQRLSMCTQFNENSSRSCLVITFYYPNHRITLVDLMGNEKMPKSSATDSAASNFFANTNFSSITQLMVNNQRDVRSHNSITNFIFKNKDLKLVLNLDPYGDVSLVKSSLTNVADALKNFKLSHQTLMDNNDHQNTNTLSKRPKRVPSYSLPTVSSSRHSPVKKVIRKTLPSPLPLNRGIGHKFRINKQPVSKTARLSSTKFVEQLNKKKAPINEKYLESIKNIKSDIGIFKNETRDLVESFVDLNNKLRVLENDSKEKAIMCEQVDQENSELKEAIETLESKLKEFEEIINELEKERDYSNTELVKSNEKLSQVNKLKTHFEKEVELGKLEQKELILEIENLTQTANNYKQIIANNETFINKYADELKTQQNELFEKNTEIEDLKSGNSTLVKKIEALEQINQETMTKHEKDFANLQIANNEIDNLNSLLKQRNEEIVKLQSMSNDVKSHQVALAEKEKQYQQLVEKEKETFKQLTELQKNWETLSAKSDKITLENADILLKLKSSNERNHQLETTLKERDTQLKFQQNELSNLSSSIDELQASLTENENEVTKHVEQNLALSSELSSTKETLANANQRFESTDKELDKVKQTLTKLETTLNEKSSLVEQLKQEIQNQNVRHETELTKTIKEHDSAIAAKDAEIKKLQTFSSEAAANEENINTSSPFGNLTSPGIGFNTDDIYNDSAVEHTTRHFHAGDNTKSLLLTNCSNSPYNLNLNSGVGVKVNTPLSTPSKFTTQNTSQQRTKNSVNGKIKVSSQNSSKYNTPKKNGILQPSNKTTSSAKKIGKKSHGGSRKNSSPLKKNAFESNKSTPLRSA